MSISNAFPQVQDISDPKKSVTDFLNSDFDFGKAFTCSKYIVKATSVVYLPNLAYIYYNDKSLWWIIAGVNGILKPLSTIEGGTIICVPDKSEVFEELTLMSQRRNPSTSSEVSI